MKFINYFRTASYLLTVSAFLSVALTGEIEAGYLAVFLVSLVLSASGADITYLSRIILIASIPYLIADFFVISGDILLSFTHLLLFVVSARLLSLRTNNDYNQLHILTFFMLLSSAALTIDISFAFTFTLYLISMTWTLLLFHLKKEVEAKADQISPVRERELDHTISLPFIINVGGIAVLSLFITLLIFFILPRMGTGFFSKRNADVIKTTGFTDQVDFGSIGPVTPDQTTVMRVALPDNEASIGGIYMKGSVLDRFNGITWEKEKSGTRPLRYNGRDFEVSSSKNTLIRQEVIIDPIDSRVIFGIDRLVLLSGSLPAVSQDNYGSVYLPFNPSSRFQYSAYSDIKGQAPEELDQEISENQGEIPEAYTSTAHIPERVKLLAYSLTGSISGRYSRVKAVEDYLRRNYTYTLNPARDIAFPPVEDFLFISRQGYCDHFSTAMVILLRAAGIPARLATGYATWEWNEIGRFYTVRQSNAHSWAEVHFPGYGWIRFEPTPPEPFFMQQGAGRLLRYAEYLKLTWDRYIISFTVRDQMRAAENIRDRTRSGVEAIRTFIGSVSKMLKPVLMWVVVVCVVIIVLYVFFIRKNALPSKTTFGRGIGSPVVFYSEMLRLLSLRGIHKSRNMAPREFAADVLKQAGDHYKSTIIVTNAFEKVRYGGLHLSKQEMKEINDILRSLKSIKHRSK